MNNENAFELEWQNTIQTLADKNKSLKELEYFLNLGREYAGLYNDCKNTPKIVMVGTSFPEEIIRAMDIEYRYVLGGSFESTLADSVNLPKDADDGARSIVGMLKNDSLTLSKEDVVIIPLYNDNMKKLKSIVSDLATVVCFEVPSDKENPILKKRFVREIDRVTSELKKHFKKRLSLKKLREQCALSKQAAEAFASFENVCRESVLSDSAFLFIANSYKWCRDKADWCLHLNRLTDEIKGTSSAELSDYPEVLFFGSPIYAPDYKVMFVIEEMKLRIHTIIHPDVLHIKMTEKIDCKSVSVENLATKYFEADISPAFINNTTMIELVMQALDNNQIRGIIAHILKGQIEYDYEFKNIERLITDYKIPMNRIETVFNYQDIEQLRLRLEAFSEMLNMTGKN